MTTRASSPPWPCAYGPSFMPVTCGHVHTRRGRLVSRAREDGEPLLGRHEFRDDIPLTMAIVNRTPDSFYDRGATWRDEAARDRVRQVVADGPTSSTSGARVASPAHGAPGSQAPGRPARTSKRDHRAPAAGHDRLDHQLTATGHQLRDELVHSNTGADLLRTRGVTLHVAVNAAADLILVDQRWPGPPAPREERGAEQR